MKGDGEVTYVTFSVVYKKLHKLPVSLEALLEAVQITSCGDFGPLGHQESSETVWLPAPLSPKHNNLPMAIQYNLALTTLNNLLMIRQNNLVVIEV